MMNYKSCPLKKRPVVFECQQGVQAEDQPQDLSMKRGAEAVLYNEPKRASYCLDLSTNSMFDQMRYSTSVRSDSPTSSITSSTYYTSSVSPRTEMDYPAFRHNSASGSPPLTLWTPYLYHLTPPTSPGSSSEPEDLSVKSYAPIRMPQPVAQELSTPKAKECTRYICDKCNKCYSTSTGLSKHQQFHCPAAECNQVKKTYSCDTCDRSYTTMGALKMHVRTHTLPCKCPICGKAFSRPWLLQGHIRTHTGEKPFSCDQCDRAFADRSNLRAHQQTHFEVKKYVCDGCFKSFSRMSLLNKHMATGCGCAKPESA